MLCTTCAQAAGPWSKTACCAVSGNECRDSGTCVDKHAASDFLFRLQPGEPQRFRPATPEYLASHATQEYLAYHQLVGPDSWPRWGLGDLWMGDDGGPPGTRGLCNQGNTYAGRGNYACGGNYDSNWGRTDLEAWYLEEEGG